MTPERFSKLIGKFTWNYSCFYFIETAEGNFTYSCPDYNGTGEVKPFNGSSKDFFGNLWGRHKGVHVIEDFLSHGWYLNTDS